MHPNITMCSLPSEQEPADMRIRRMIKANFPHPFDTRQVRVALENLQFRVECNLVRNVATLEEGLALRIAPANTQCMVVIIPIFADGRLLLISRYRYAASRWSVEFPRSSCPVGDDEWKNFAEEQLLLDAGLRAQSMRLLGAIQIDPALISTSTLVILATGCEGPRSSPADPTRAIAGSVAATLEEFDQLVRDGDIICSTTLSAMALYRALPG